MDTPRHLSFSYSYECRSRKKHLTIYWDRYSKNDFWYIWLYDNAPANRHANGQKLTTTYQIPSDIQPREVHWDAENLYITWTKSAVVYPLDWLKKHTPSVLIPRSKPNLWVQRSNHPIFDYEELRYAPTNLLNCLQEIKNYGFTRIKNVPVASGTVLKLVDLFGYVRATNYGQFYDVVAKKDPENLADTAMGLAPHTDNPYRNPTPTIQLLHCLKADVSGGKTILVDGFYLEYV
ncbi:MAG: TauD/TfdA family dioxygenase [Bacteroidota bacterium]